MSECKGMDAGSGLSNLAWFGYGLADSGWLIVEAPCYSPTLCLISVCSIHVKRLLNTKDILNSKLNKLNESDTDWTSIK